MRSPSKRWTVAATLSLGMHAAVGMAIGLSSRTAPSLDLPVGIAEGFTVHLEIAVDPLAQPRTSGDGSEPTTTALLREPVAPQMTSEATVTLNPPRLPEVPREAHEQTAHSAREALDALRRQGRALRATFDRAIQDRMETLTRAAAAITALVADSSSVMSESADEITDDEPGAIASAPSTTMPSPFENTRADETIAAAAVAPDTRANGSATSGSTVSASEHAGAGEPGIDRSPTATAGNRPPKYPAAARRLGQSGTVRVRAIVEPDGCVSSASIAESSGFELLDNAALEAAAKWRFTPASAGGRAVRSEVVAPIRFVLR